MLVRERRAEGLPPKRTTRLHHVARPTGELDRRVPGIGLFVDPWEVEIRQPVLCPLVSLEDALVNQPLLLDVEVLHHGLGERSFVRVREAVDRSVLRPRGGDDVHLDDVGGRGLVSRRSGPAPSCRVHPCAHRALLGRRPRRHRHHLVGRIDHVLQDPFSALWLDVPPNAAQPTSQDAEVFLGPRQGLFVDLAESEL